MSVYKRGNVFYSRIMRDGAITVRPLGVRTKVDAKRLESVIITRMAEGKLGIAPPPEPPKVPTVEEFASDYLNLKVGRIADATFTAYNKAIQVLIRLPELANCPLDQVKPKVVNQFINMCNRETYAVCSTNQYLKVLRAMLQEAQRQEIITKVPKIEMLKGENRREYVISEADEQRLIEAQWKTTGGLIRKTAPITTEMPPLMRVLIPFLIDTGLRIEEACALTWDDVANNAITVRKGKSAAAARTIPLTIRAAKIISDIKATSESTHIFVRSKDWPIDQAWASKHFTNARKAIGLPKGCVLHSTRHTFCTRLAKLGASSFELQKLAGHSSIVMSARYCHPDTEQLTGAINRLNKGEK